jgi:hypothetical protein
MSASPIEAVAPAALTLTQRQRNHDHRFFTGMAVVTALTTVVGFAPTYYFRGFTAEPPLTTLVHVHGALATSWMLLFLVQTSLVSAGRSDLHRRLGVAGIVIATLFVAVGYSTAIGAARRGVTAPGGPPPLGFLAIPLGTLLSFAILAAVGISQRRHRDTHKRLMLLATIAMVTPAFARFRWFGPGGPPVAIGGTCLLVIACLAYDRSTRGRVHPAFLWGGVLLMLSLPARFAMAQSETWLSVARWLTR